MKIGLSLALALIAAPCLAENAAGVVHLQDTSIKDRPLSLSIWYPSADDASIKVGGTAVFEGTPAALHAEVPEGAFQLVVVSHGGLRSAADSGAWLSSSIAQAGYVVVEVNAPRPVKGAEALNEIWQRPRDIRRAMDWVLADESLGPQLDDRTVSVAGFALGATAALSVAGAALDSELYMHACADARDASGPDCAWYTAQGTALSETPQEGLGTLVHDPRVTSVITLNPEYPATLGPVAGNVEQLQLVLGSVGDDEIGPAVSISQASVLDAFPVCTDAGPDILMAEGGDPAVCGTSPEARQKIHHEIFEAIVSFLDSTSE